jgi:predicted TIM-barrel fold metal-dependent hydrolase
LEIIDIHAHIYPEKIAQRATAAIGEFYGEKMQVRAGTAERLIFEGAAAGITRYAVHSVATVPRQVRAINEFIADEVARHAELIGFITLHQELTEAEIDSEIAWGVKNGFKGIKLHPDFQKFNIDDSCAEKIYRAAAGRMPVLMHVGDDRYDYSKPHRLAAVAKKYPGTNFIAAHFGAYRCWESAEVYRGSENVFFDTCSSLAFISTQRARELISFYGAERFLFGTDFPMWDAAGEIERFDKIPMSDQERVMIYSGNAKRILGLDT